MIEESPIDLGNGLTGVLTRPQRPTAQPLWVLLNAGFIPRCGPFRMHVELARSLAAEGVPVLRVDLPGVGDAPPKRGDDIAVIRHGFDRLRELAGADRFVIGGLCSAADQAWKVALADERVCGLLLLDPYASRGAWFRIGQLRILLGRGASAMATVLGRLLRRKRAPDIDDGNLRDWPRPADARVEFDRIVARGVDVFALYTGGAASYFTHRAQFGATFGASASARCVHFEHWPDCDHMFMRAQDRARLLQAIRDWGRVFA
jgi:pimeloyl-ACP methyl ester carboxylesterase